MVLTMSLLPLGGCATWATIKTWLAQEEAWGFKGIKWFPMDTAAARGGPMPSPPDSDEELCMDESLAHRGQRLERLSAGKGAFSSLLWAPEVTCLLALRSHCPRVTRQCLSACSVLSSGQCKRRRSFPQWTFHFKVKGAGNS